MVYSSSWFPGLVSVAQTIQLCVVSDPDLPWDQILKMLNANMPEEVFVWISNLKQIVTPLLERAMELLQAIP